MWLIAPSETTPVMSEIPLSRGFAHRSFPTDELTIIRISADQGQVMDEVCALARRTGKSMNSAGGRAVREEIRRGW